METIVKGMLFISNGILCWYDAERMITTAINQVDAVSHMPNLEWRGMGLPAAAQVRETAELARIYREGGNVSESERHPGGTLNTLGIRILHIQ